MPHAHDSTLWTPENCHGGVSVQTLCGHPKTVTSQNPPQVASRGDCHTADRLPPHRAHRGASSSQRPMPGLLSGASKGMGVGAHGRATLEGVSMWRADVADRVWGAPPLAACPSRSVCLCSDLVDTREQLQLLSGPTARTAPTPEQLLSTPTAKAGSTPEQLPCSGPANGTVHCTGHQPGCTAGAHQPGCSAGAQRLPVREGPACQGDWCDQECGVWVWV